MRQPGGLLFVFLITILSPFAWTETGSWVGGISSNFTDSGNWNPAVDLYDEVGDVLTVGAGTLFDPVYNHKLPTRPNSFNTTELANFTMTGGEFLPYGNNTLNGNLFVLNGWLSSRGYVYLGSGQTGTVTVNGGTFGSKSTLYIGRNSGGNGTLNVLEGIVDFPSRPVVGSNGGIGRIYLEEGGFCYIGGNDTLWFQGLADSGVITTAGDCAVVIDYQPTLNRTRITAEKIKGATLPVPWDKTEDTGITGLSWKPGTLAMTSKVYFGTSPESLQFIGSTTGNEMTLPYALSPDTPYFWRVDTTNPWGAITGVIWSFTPVTVLKPRRMERLDRGVIAVRSGSSNYIGWRLFGTDTAEIAFNVYRGGTRINGVPVTASTNYVDTEGSLSDVYSVRPVLNGQEQGGSESAAVLAAPYYNIPVGQVPGDSDWSYEINDGAVGDLDGDGNYELVIKRFSGDYWEFPVIEGYRLDGTFLWRINLGPNHLVKEEINPLVYDFDGDGRAEVALRTCEGMTDGIGTTTGDTDGNGVTDYRIYGADDGFIDAGPEFLSIFDGLTGVELARTEYIPRVSLTQWGDTYGHRANKFHMVAAYLDGHRPSLVICRGIYGLTKMEGWNYRDGKLYKLWHFNSEDWPGFGGQGNHNLSVGDVDSDGKDEIVYGGMCVDHDGTGLYSTEQGHGDAMHLSDMDPDRPGLEVWRCVETAVTGAAFTNAATGEILFEYDNGADVGRACAGDIDPRYRGYEMWGSTNCPMYTSQGAVIGPSSLPMNFMIWWDGDLLRETLDHAGLTGAWYGRIGKWDYVNGREDTLLAAAGTLSNNWTKGTPVLSGDILGDWREEALWRSDDNRSVRIYTTTIPTSHRIYTLMHDPQYRLAIAWQCCGYNQPPHPGFYLGDGMAPAPQPYIELFGGDPEDAIAPSPDPMGWAVKPYVSGNHAIAMQAAEAGDPSGVEYYFTCTAGGGYDSGWQESAHYEDAGLTEGVTYTYTVKARDRSASRNTTRASVPASATASAAAVAYWRFEEGPAGAAVSHGGAGSGVYYEGTADSSGNGYGLSVWAEGWAGYAYASDVGVSQVPQTGAVNRYSVKNTGNFPVLYTDTADAINDITPAAFTIEASFKLANGNFRTIVGRDSYGSYTSEPALAALYLQAMPNNALAVKFCDVAGYWHEALSAAGVFLSYDNTVNPDGIGVPWYSMAAVSDGASLSLYLKNLTAGTGWHLIARTDMTLSGSPNTTLAKGTGDGADWNAGDWTVGRGLYDGVHTDRAFGYIDEVRVCDSPLSVEEFLSSKSQTAPWVYGDFTGDHFVDYEDAAVLSGMWLWDDCDSLKDFDRNDNCVIDLFEVLEMAGHWLTTD